MHKNKTFIILVAALACVALISTGVAVFASSRIARAQVSDFRIRSDQEFDDPSLGENGIEFSPPPGPGFPGGGRMHVKGGEPAFLAKALGISVEQLKEAQIAAYQKGIEQALEQGLLTEGQAEWLKDRPAGMLGIGPWLGGWLKQNRAMDMEALLAKELGISLEELRQARQNASEAALQAAVDDGKFSQEQADLIQARQAVRNYIDRQTLEAQALGMTVEELQAAREEGKFFPELIKAQGLSQEEFQSAMQAAYEEAINQAVADGVITQAQADLLLADKPGPGQGFLAPIGPGRFPGRNQP